MRTNLILKIIIDILFFFLSLGALGAVIISFMSLFTLNLDLLSYTSYPLPINNKWIIPISILNIFIPIFFFLGIGYLRAVAKCFLKKKWYHEKIVRYFRLSGRYLTITAIIGLFSYFLYTFTTENRCRLPDSSLKNPHSILFMLITGLCFIMISRILKETIEAKQENDLTI